MNQHAELDSGLQPSLKPVPAASQEFAFNHTMLRVKDPRVSLAFYTGILGMTLLIKRSYPKMSFDLYFLARLAENEILPRDAKARTEYTFSRQSVLELTHNYGTENDADFSYHSGNDAPQGFGHICFSVPDLDAAIAWFDENGVQYVKRPEEGKMKNIAFIKDPDGYWIEIVQASKMA